MASTNAVLTRAWIGLSVVLVVGLAGLAFYNLLNNSSDGQAADNPVQVDPGGPARPYPGSRMVIDDSAYALSIGCLPAVDQDDIYLIVIENRGAATADYIVTADLTAGEDRVGAMATANDLRPGEEREVILLTDGDLSAPDDCIITGIETERRVLLGR